MDPKPNHAGIPERTLALERIEAVLCKRKDSNNGHFTVFYFREELLVSTYHKLIKLIRQIVRLIDYRRNCCHDQYRNFRTESLTNSLNEHEQ